MTEKKVLRDVMYEKRISQQELAQKAGYKSQSNIGGMLNNNANGIRMDNLLRMFNALGCDIVIRDREEPHREWIIDSCGDR